MKSRLLAVVAALVFSASAAQAGTILYWVDFALGTDQMAAALAASSHAVTTATGEADFVTQVGAGGWDLVIFMNQDLGNASAQAAIEGWVTGGGKAIFTDWTRDGLGTLTTAAAFDASYTGNNNQTSVAISSPVLLSGLVSPLTLLNPGWSVFSMGMSALPGGNVAATFGNGEAAIIFGNGGSTIINGFLTDTFATGSDGVTLYTNEIDALLAQPVPEPTTLGLVGAGVLALAARRRRA